MKKSQVTLFIIFAIVILLIFSVLIIIVSDIGSKEIETARTVITESDITFNEFHSFFQVCLNNALDESVYLLGKQGGFIFQDQKGSIVDFDIKRSEFSDYNVTHVVEFARPPYILAPPGYPCIMDSASGWPAALKGNKCLNNFSHIMPDIISLRFGNYQLINKIVDVNVPLCGREHYFNLTSNQPNPNVALQPICKPSNIVSKNNYSIENQIKGYINYKLEECYLESLKLLNESDIIVRDRGNFSIQIDFNDFYTNVLVRFPIILDYFKADTIFKDMEFISSSRVRLKTIFSLLYANNILLKNLQTDFLEYNKIGIIDYDIYNLTYDIETDSYDLMNKYGIFNISIHRIPTETGGSIIKLIDNLSIINGKNYEYQLYVENRLPILDTYNFYARDDYNIYLYEGDFLFLSPLAFDPDDDKTLIYEYEILDDDWKWRQNFLDDNDLYNFGKNQSYECVHPKYGVVANRCTGFLLNDSDRGSHEIKISVKDRAGFEDSQIIKLFVDNKPELKIEINNIYEKYGVQQYYFDSIDSVNRYIVSREDPFILNTSGSLFSGPPSITKLLQWKDTKNTNVAIQPNSDQVIFNLNYPFKFRTVNPVIVHPGYQNYSSYDALQNVLDTIQFKINILNSNPYLPNDYVLSHLVELRNNYTSFNISHRQGYPIINVNSKSSILLSYFKDGHLENTTEKDILIVDCIPYRNNTPCYPFNLVKTNNESRSFNHYLSNHTCCSGDLSSPETWAYQSAGSLCYDSFEIGTYNDFMNDDSLNISLDIFKEIYPGFNVFNPANGGNVISPKDPLFDMYVRILKGECTGDRGNICEPKEFKILKIPYCGQGTVNNDFNMRLRETFFGVNHESHGYYDGNLCTCKNAAGVTEIYEIDGSYEDHYCCFDSVTKIPTHLNPPNRPCTLVQCNQYDTRIGGLALKIGSTTLPAGEYCYCHDPSDIVNVITHSDHYCCNPSGIDEFIVKSTLSACNI